MCLKLERQPDGLPTLIFILSVTLLVCLQVTDVYAGTATVAFDHPSYKTYADIAIIKVTDNDTKFVGNGKADSIEIEVTNPARVGVDKPEVIVLTEIDFGPDMDKGIFRGAIGFEPAEIPCNGAVLVNDTSNQITATYLPAQFDPSNLSQNLASNAKTATSTWSSSGTAANTSPGRVFFDKSNYVGNGITANIFMIDNNLTGPTQNVILTSETDTTGITITLQKDPGSSLYKRTVTLSSTATSGGTTLRVSNGDIITVRYSDASFDPNSSFANKTNATAKWYSITPVSSHISCSATRPGGDGKGLGGNTFPTTGVFTPTLAFEFPSYVGTTAQDGTRARIILTAPSSAGIGQAVVKVTSQDDTVGFNVTLNETPTGNGTFIGLVGFDTAASDKNQSIIKVKNDTVVTASITGLSPATTIWHSSTSPSTIRFVDSTFLADVSTIALGDFTYIQLFDADRADNVQAVSVAVNGANGSDSESVALARVDGGTFRGQIRTRNSAVNPPASGSSFLEVAVGDVITVTYLDNNPVGTATDSVTVSQPVAPGAKGVVSFDKDVYTGTAQAANITLTDSDLPAGTQTVKVTSTSDPTGITVNLTGTGGTFNGQVGFSTTSSGGGLILVKDGDTITVTYNDANDGTGSPAVATDTALWFAQLPTSKGEVLFDRDSYSGTTAIATITLRDGDLVSQTSQNVRVASTSDQTGVNITLSSSSGGTFTGQLKFSTTSSDDASDSIRVADGDTITVTYNDANDGTGSPAVATDTALWFAQAPTAKGEVLFDAEDYFGTSAVATITLRDSDLAGQTTQTVRVTSSTDPTGIDMTLNNVNGAGTFTGRLNFSTTNSNTTTGTIRVSDSDIVTVTYNDANDGTSSPAVATDTAVWHDTVVGPITSKGVIFFDKSLYVGLSDLANITLRDIDLASDNTVAITLTSSADGRGITVNLARTQTAGEFQGAVGFAAERSNQAGGLIGVLNGSSRLIATYNDANDGTGRAAVAASDAVWIDSLPTSGGRMVFDKRTYEGTTDEDGTVAQITLIDSDLTGPSESILITSNTDSTGISFILPRITPAVPGVYSRTLKFSRRMSETDSAIWVSSGDRVRAVYQDLSPGREVWAEATWIDLTPPAQTALRRPFPNPFDPAGGPITVGFDLQKPGYVRFLIYNIVGELVREFDLGRLGSRSYRNSDAVQWDGRNDRGRMVESGIYIGALVVRLDEGSNEIKFVKMAVIR